MSMTLIDTHTHLDFPDFETDRRQILDDARHAGVERLIVVSVGQDNWQRVWDCVGEDTGLYAALGLHPIFLQQHRPEHLDELREWLQRLRGDRKLCALGEFGLDYFIDEPDRDSQQFYFERQLALASEFDLPVLLHVRRAHAETIATLKRVKPARGGVIHAFTGSYEQASEYMRLGFCLGLGGAPTWPQAHRLHRMLRRLPLEAIVLETDSPDMAPAMHPNQRNTPAWLGDICRRLAEIREVTPEELAAASTVNACRLFGWDDALPERR